MKEADDARVLRQRVTEIKALPASERRGRLGDIKRAAMRHLLDLGVPAPTYLLIEELVGLPQTGRQNEYRKDGSDEVMQQAAIFEANQPRDETYEQPSTASLRSISEHIRKAFKREDGDYRRSIERFRGKQRYWEMVEGYREDDRYPEMMSAKGTAWRQRPTAE